MKRYTLAFSLAAVVVFTLFSVFGPASARGRSSTVPSQRGAGINEDTSAPTPAAVTLGAATRGVVFRTAAINSDGTIASCFTCFGPNTIHLATGQYQVGFAGNVQATNGWSRWVQVDTLTTGAIFDVTCTTADRAGLASGVFVLCTNTSGTPTDTSFFLFVAR